MKKILILAIALGLIIPAAFCFAAEKEHFVGGTIDNIKVYDSAKEKHGFTLRIDIKRGIEGKKNVKIYLNKDTVVVDSNGNKMDNSTLKVGKAVQVKYMRYKSDKNFDLARKITVQ